MYRYLLLCVIWLTGSGCHALAQTHPTVFLVGESTVATFAERYAPMRGWGQEFGKFFVEELTLDNRAVAGKSSRSFVEEGVWSRVLADVEAGDYVLIQFGHNDQKRDHRATDPYGSYQQFLAQYVNDTRQKAATPILVTPVVRRRFRSNGELYDTHGSYPDAMRQLATELNVPLIDLHQRSGAYFTALGEEATKALFLWLSPGESPNYPRGLQDNTHFSRYGAQEVGRLATEGLLALEVPLKNYLIGCPEEIAKTVTICQGDSAWIEDGFQRTSGTYRHLYQNQQGCDSTVVTTLEVLPTYHREYLVEINEGDSIWTGQQYRYRTGTYSDTLQTQQGCDSVLVTTLRVIPAPIQTQIAITLCAGDSLLAEGHYQKAGGTYYDTLTDASGAQTITITILEVAKPVALPAIIVHNDALHCIATGDNYRWFLEGDPLVDTTATLAARQEGHYSVAVRVGACFSQRSDAYYYQPPPVITGLSDEDRKPLRVYRPGSGPYLRVEGTASAGQFAELSVYDLLGNRLYHHIDHHALFETDIYFDKQPEGLYIVTLAERNKRTSVKFYWSSSTDFFR